MDTLHRAPALARLALLLLVAPAALDAQTRAPVLDGSRHADPPAVADHPRVRQALRLATSWLDAQRAYLEIPGISAAMVQDWEVLWSGGFGLADPERGVPADASTVYSICSISKLFTAISVMQLRDAGKLRLDDPVERHLSWFDIRRVHPDAPAITIEGLLTHSAGLPRESDYPYWTGDFDFPTREEIVSRLPEQETLYPASRYFQYSNLGLTLAGEVVAAASGEPFEAYVRRAILEPLGLRGTTPAMPEAGSPGLARGHSAMTRSGNREPVAHFAARGIGPAAGFASTAEDLARFAAWQFRLLKGGGPEVLSANTLREMQRVHWVDPDFDTTWGLGFAVRRAADETFVGHGGSCPGYRTTLLLQPKDRIATIFMANASGVDTETFVQGMYAIVAPAVRAAREDTLSATTDTAPGTPPDSALARYEGSYSDFPWAGETLVLPWKNGLAMVSLPTARPMEALTELRKVEGREHTFRRVREDGELGETIVFELGPDGRATRFWQHSNPSERMRDTR